MARTHEVLQKANNVIQMSDDFMNKEVLMLKFSVMAQAPIGEWIKIAEGVDSKLIERKKNFIVFYVKADEDAVLDWHEHDCEEYWKIIKGQLLRDTFEGVIKAYVRHRFVFMMDTTMIVEFRL